MDHSEAESLNFHIDLLWIKHVIRIRKCNWFDSTFINHGWKKKLKWALKQNSGLKPSQVSCSGYLFKDRRKMYQFPEHMTVKKDDFCTLVNWTSTSVKTAFQKTESSQLPDFNFSIHQCSNYNWYGFERWLQLEKKKQPCIVCHLIKGLDNTSTWYNLTAMNKYKTP